jgi:hypothetical protein
VRFDNVPIEDIPELTRDNYKPDDTTPLYDAICESIERLKKQKKTIFVIMTDGLENASHYHSQKDAFTLITKWQKKGWSFVYLGANQDAYVASESIGISQKTTSNFNQANTGVAMAAAANVSYRLTSDKNAGFTDEEIANMTK